MKLAFYVEGDNMEYVYVELDESDIIHLAKKILDRDPANDKFEFCSVTTSNNVYFDELSQKIKVRLLKY